jgi:hypothetical protein
LPGEKSQEVMRRRLRFAALCRPLERLEKARLRRSLASDRKGSIYAYD